MLFVILHDHRRYEGRMELAGIPNGAGVLTYSDGCIYEGDFKPHKDSDPASDDIEIILFRSKRHGKGTFKWADERRYDGDWAENRIHGVGVMTWPDGRKFSGSFCCSSPEKGTLEESSGTWNVRYDTTINLFENEDLSEPDSRREMGRITAKLWGAISNGAADSYRVLGASELCASDRALVKYLHTAEKVFTRDERKVFTIEYTVGEHAGQQILRAFSGNIDDAVITKMQWAVVPRPSSSDSTTGTDHEDLLQEMFRVAARRMPGFKLTTAGSIQPDPLATRNFDQLKSSFVAAGRMVGAALWHGKLLRLLSHVSFVDEL